MVYQRVLAAIDVGDEDGNIVAEARRIADEHGAKLSILTVVKPLTQVYGGLDMVAYSQASLNFEHEAEQLATERLQELGLTAGVDEADRHVALGIPAHEIVEHAKDNDIDLIVVGSHGKHGFGLLLGSVANGVLHHAECDVLTIRIK